MSTYLPNIGDRVTIAHPSFSGNVYVVTGVGSNFVEVSPTKAGHAGHASFSFGAKAADLRPVTTIEDPTMKALWDDIGDYYTGDARAWAFVNHVVNGLPYATR
jgi:hypothetical protein